MTKTARSPHKSDVDACLLEWTSREMQLVRLHEEILSKREALLNCSLAYSQSQFSQTLSEANSLEHALVRNHKLLQDIKLAKNEAELSLNMSPTPRFMTLQKNYWSMVKSQVPMWEQDHGIRPGSTDRFTPRDSTARSKTPRTPQTPIDPDIAAQIISKSPSGVQPKKLQKKKQHDARLKASLQKK
ncbi:hypothetical protein ACF0H5_019808 [Mactra antiquata]